MILMNDFQKEYKVLRLDINKAIESVLKSGWHILGPRVKRFEQEFASFIGAKYCVGVANGLEAIQIALMACGIKANDEVLTVSNSAVATALAITNIGATPVFVDVDKYHHMDVNSIEDKITDKTTAILPVHLFGQVANMEAIIRIAKKYKLKVIEDACQAHGAELNGKKAGVFGSASAFSFYPTKNLGGYGDGGAIITNDRKVFEMARKLRNYGSDVRYIHTLKGINSRLDEIQAAILSLKLKKLNSFIKNRNKIANLYFENLKDIDQITLPLVRKNSYHSFHLFVVMAKNRINLMEYLKEKGIQSLIHYPRPIHKQKCYAEFNKLNLPITEDNSNVVLSLPIHPYLTKKEVLTVCRHIKNFYKK